MKWTVPLVVLGSFLLGLLVLQTTLGAFIVSHDATGEVNTAVTAPTPTPTPTPPPDSDGDGVPDDSDNCPAWANAGQALPPWPVTLDGSDPDCDGWSTDDENIIGTDPNLACGPDAWPPDIDGNQMVDIFDVNLLAPPVFFSETVDPDYSARRDIDPDGIIDIFDVNLMAPPIFFATCTP